jgi:RNA 2',3'-cyclic 3'-phosphodiesterase
MRLFIAVDVPENVKQELSRLQKEFYGLGKITFVKDVFHCTLKFLGEVHSTKLGGLKERLNRVKFRPFEAKLDGIGVFPNEKFIMTTNIGTIWVGLKGNVNELHEAVDKALIGMFEKDPRFHAHITLGRVKFIEDEGRVKKKLKLKVPGITFRIDCFKLMMNKLSSHGSVYEVVGEYPLK